MSCYAHRAALVLSLAAFAAACSNGSSDKEDADTGETGSGEGEGEGEGEGDDGLPSGMRPLATPSGACPDLTTSGFVTMQSAGIERSATVVVPAAPSGPMAVVFFFHGLMDPSSTPQPTESMASALNMQSLADTHNAVVLIPEAPIYDLLGFEFFLWDIAVETDADLILFDDLRACSADQLDVDLARTTAWGFSGGALFTTVMASQRGDAFAAIVEASGGSDIEVPIWSEPAARYETPAHKMPALLMSGGESDVWPDPSLAIVDFEAATDTLTDQLASDDHTVVRCWHSTGHNITNAGFNLSIDWLMSHTFGEPSPWAGGDLGGDSDWCELINAGS